MAWADTYKELAVEINGCIEDKPNGMAHAREASMIMTDLQGSDEATLIETSLFYDVYTFYLYVYQSVWYEDYAKTLVERINSFTIKNYGGDLTAFVNSIVWDDGCVPYYWAIYSEEAGHDISEWSVCS
jgi:hypothetical protein